MRSRLVVTIVSVCISMCAPERATAQLKQEDEVAANVALAERLAHMSQLMLADHAIVPETLRQSTALLDAAMKLNPNEIRYPRLAAEAALQLRDTEAAIDAYKSIWRLDPADQIAQIRLTDLYVSRMETADQRLDYLAKLISSPTIPAEVRAHAAYLSALVLVEKSQREEAIKRLDESLGLFPLSPEALKKKWELQSSSLTAKERVQLLLTMLKSNPGQPGVMADIATELGAIGLGDLALKWYGNALDLGGSVGRGIDASDLTRYLAQLIISNQENAAEPMLDRLITGDPGNIDAAYLEMLIQRRSGNADKLGKAKLDAQNALSRLAFALHEQLPGNKPPGAPEPTTQEVPSIDLAADLAQLQQVDNPQLRAGYASLLADFAWIELYFNCHSAEAEPYLAQIRLLAPQDSPILARLEGWQLLNAGKIDEAKSKLSAAAEQDDALAKLGLLEIQSKDPASKDQVKEAALELFHRNPTGLMGAILSDALRDKITAGPGLPIPPQEGSEDMRALVEDFPKAWLDFVAKPNTMYTLRAEPLKVVHVYGEPILAQVSIKNTGPYDITIGPDSAIRPDLWFDLQLRGLVQQGLQGVTFDRIGQRVVLKPQESISQIVRLDQGQLSALLRANPSVAIPLYFSVFTNPITLQTGISPGPGGQRVQLSKVVNRAPTPLANEQAIDALIARLNTEPPETKMQLIDLLGSYSRAFLAQQDAKVKAKGADMFAAVRRAANKDPLAPVRAYAQSVVAYLADKPEERDAQIKQLLTNQDWTQRLLGLVVLETLEREKWKDLAKPLAESDPDATVKTMALALVEFADNPASIRPATTQPSPDGAAPPSAASSGQ